ncbi:CRPV-127 [Crowpox virus]|nr:CRPV-127 [Crowpox virus]
MLQGSNNINTKHILIYSGYIYIFLVYRSYD